MFTDIHLIFNQKTATKLKISINSRLNKSKQPRDKPTRHFKEFIFLLFDASIAKLNLGYHPAIKSCLQNYKS